MKKLLTPAFAFSALCMFSACDSGEGNKDSLTGGHGTEDNAPFSNIGEETGPEARSEAHMPGNDSTYITTDSVIPTGGQNANRQQGQ